MRVKTSSVIVKALIQLNYRRLFWTQNPFIFQLELPLDHPLEFLKQQISNEAGANDIPI